MKLARTTVLGAALLVAATAVPGYAEVLTGTPSTTNLALNRVVKTAQRPCTAAEAVGKIVDGSSAGAAAKWCSADGRKKTAEIDLGSQRQLVRFVVRHAGAGGESATYNTRDFSIEVSTSGFTWSTVVTKTANTASVTEHAVNTTARYVRFSTTDPVARIYEVEAFGPATAPNSVSEQFDALDPAAWGCEYSCPTVSGGTAKFVLQPGAAPRTAGSWSKINYRPASFTSGRFTVRFALTARPAQKVWWGAALWTDGPVADGSQFSEVNFGYTTNQSYTNSQLLFESARRGKVASIKVDTGVNLYDGAFHTATLEYDAKHVSFIFDGRLLQTITDPTVIPADPMRLVLGPRLVTGSAPLQTGFTQTVDWADVV